MLADGPSFHDIRELKRIYSANEHDIASNPVDRLLVYATGATTTFADQEPIAEIINDAESDDFGVRSIIHSVVQSQLFRQR